MGYNFSASIGRRISKSNIKTRTTRRLWRWSKSYGSSLQIGCPFDYFFQNQQHVFQFATYLFIFSLYTSLVEISCQLEITSEHVTLQIIQLFWGDGDCNVGDQTQCKNADKDYSWFFRLTDRTGHPTFTNKEIYILDTLYNVWSSRNVFLWFFLETRINESRKLQVCFNLISTSIIQ